MQCSKCKAEIRDKAKFCPYCGSPVEKADKPETPVSTENVPSQSLIVENKSSNPDIAENEPVTADIAENEPVTADIAGDKPVTADIAGDKSVTADIAENKPVTADIAENKPVTADIAEDEPVTADIAEDEPTSTAIKPKSRLKIGVTAAAAVVIIGGISAFAVPKYVVPAVKFSAAERAYESGRYADALDGFIALGDYKDAASRITPARYMYACACAESGDYDNAAVNFEQITGYSDAAERLSDSRYHIADRLLSEHSYEQAAAGFLALGGYSDSAAKYDSAVLSFAAALAAQGDFDGAVENASKASPAAQTGDVVTYRCKAAEKKAAASDYAAALTLLSPVSAENFEGQPVSEIISEYTYQAALIAISDGSADESMARALQKIGSYKDSRQQLSALCQVIGTAYFDNGDYAAAAAMFKNAGNYQSSAALLSESFYQLGLANEESGDYESARNIFASLTSYKDSAVHRAADTAKKPGNIHKGWYTEVYTLTDGFYTTNFSGGEVLTVRGTLGNDSSTTEKIDMLVTVTMPGGSVQTSLSKSVIRGGLFSMNVTLPKKVSGDVSISVIMPQTNAILRNMTVHAE